MTKKVLNLGCGKTILKDNSKRQFINMDMLEQPADNYIRHDLTSYPYPFNSSSFDEIYLFHVIEHIPEELQSFILLEMRRLIKDEGKIFISYPEFKKCAQNYIDNKQGKSDFWKATIYGRGRDQWDRHCALMDTPVFITQLKEYGLDVIKSGREPECDYNSVVVCKRSDSPVTYSELMRKEFS